MPGITFSQEDVVSTAEIKAGWYPMTAKSVIVGPGKKDPTSTTWTCEFEVSDGELKGVKIMTWFSTKMIKQAIRYMRCFVADLKGNQEYPIEDTVGRPVQGYIVWDIENLNNTIKDFKPVGR